MEGLLKTRRWTAIGQETCVTAENTVAKAYQLLEKEKVIVTIRGKGAFLAENASQEVDKGKMQEIKTSLKEILSELRYEGYDEEKIANLIHEIYQDLEG